MNQPSEQDIQDAKRHVRQHLIIAGFITLGTITTYFTSQKSLGGHTMAFTLFIACVQAFLVAGFFMHLLSEKKMIYSFLVFTAIFFVVLMGMDYLAHMPSNIVHYSQ